MTQHTPARALPVFLGLALALVGCDSAPATPDAGGEEDAGPPMADAGPRPDAGPGDDAGPGTDAGPELGERSSLTLFLRTGPVTFDALDEDGAEVVVTAGYAESDGDLFFAADTTLYEFNATSRRMTNPTELLDAAETGTIAPELMFSVLVGTDNYVIAIAGTNAYIWDPAPAMGMPRFSDPLPLQQKDGPSASESRPYDPPALGYISLDNASFFLAGISESNENFMLETMLASFTYIPLSGGISLCNPGAPLTPEFLTHGIVPGAPSSAVPTILLVDGDRVYARSSSGLCFEDGVQLVDEADSVIDAPTVAFAANFDGSSDNSQEVLVVAETIE